MKMTNPLTAAQSYQQAPLGIQQQMAQLAQAQAQQGAQQQQGQEVQQAQPSLDQSQLAAYIKQLQDSGASDDQINGVVQQIQDNGGQLPDQATPPSQGDGSMAQGGTGSDTVANDTGNDTISGGNDGAPQSAPNISGAAPQQSPLSQALNQMASGQGGINYDQVGEAYPKSQPLQQMSPLDSFASNALKGSNAGNIASIFKAVEGGRADQLAQQNAAIAQQNAQALGAYGSQVGIAKEAGTLQSQKRTNDRMATNEEKRTDIMQQNADADKLKPLGTDKDGNAVLYNVKDGTIQTVPNVNIGKPTASKPLSADIQKQLNLGLDQFLGTRDSKGNTIPDGKDIDPTQKNQILSAAAIYLQQNPNVGAQGAIGHIITEKLGGVDNIQDATSPWFGKKTPRMFPADKVQGLVGSATPQTAPDVSGGAPASAPATSGEDDNFTPTKNGMPAPDSKSAYDALPSGTKYVYKDGSIRTKP